MAQKIKVSVLISTLDRPQKLLSCLKSIFKNLRNDYEVIVVDQSKISIKPLTDSRLCYYHLPGRGKSRALNFALKKAKGQIIAFTDDDCIVSGDWLEKIAKSFKKNEDIVGAFGNVYPYLPRQKKELFCPSLFLSKSKKLITKPGKHWELIGFGNNMAFQRKIFEKIGYFKEWLGPGSIGRAAEDAEFSLRVLLNGEKILHDPLIVVYHNRWLTKKENGELELDYLRGESTCYSYLMMKGLFVGRQVIKDDFKNNMIRIKQSVKDKNFGAFYLEIRVLFSLIFGSILGVIHALDGEN